MVHIAVPSSMQIRSIGSRNAGRDHRVSHKKSFPTYLLAHPITPHGPSSSRSARSTRGRGGGGGGGAFSDGGGPSSHHPVRDRESMAEEILDLKKKIVRLTEEANVGKARNRRLEEDNKNKEKQLDALLDPSKSDEMRRTLGKVTCM